MNQIMISKFELLKIKYPSVINIVGNYSRNKTQITREIINNLSSHNTITIFSNQLDDYKGLNNTTIYNDTIVLNKVVKNIIDKQGNYSEEKSVIIFDQIPYLYKNYYIFHQLLQISKSFNIITIIVDSYPEIPQNLFCYIDYAIFTHDLTSSISYKKELYKVYGKMLESYNQFYAIYKDICQDQENKSLIIDYTQKYYIPERMLSWFELQNPSQIQSISPRSSISPR